MISDIFWNNFMKFMLIPKLLVSSLKFIEYSLMKAGTQKLDYII